MEKRRKKEHDFSVTAFRVVQEATGQIEPKPKSIIDYKALGQRGGLKGGKARANKLSSERRKEITRKAFSKFYLRPKYFLTHFSKLNVKLLFKEIKLLKEFMN